MKVLVTGGAGYIGSHACVALVERGHEPVIVDSFANSSPDVIARLGSITGHALESHAIDVRDAPAMRALMCDGGFEAVLHFAGLKAVGDSCERPQEYLDNNVGGSRVLLEAMQAAGVPRLVFSSSASVYGEVDLLPVSENAPLRPASPYAESKRMVEELLVATSRRADAFRSLSLRYFNPVGAHPSGELGENPSNQPSNLMPMICRVAIGMQKHLSIFGDDWPTPDGTGVRDYLHVVDLAGAHVDALEYLQRDERHPAINLGAGRGVSVRELIAAFEHSTGNTVSCEIAGRRAGDVACLYADASLARSELGWMAKAGIEQMCRDAWRWESKRPIAFPA